MKVTVDALILALAELIEQADRIDCVKVHLDTSDNFWSSDQVDARSLDLILDGFRALVGNGRTIDEVKLKGCPSRSEEYPAQQGEIEVRWRDEATTYTLTISQLSVHAQGGQPYGAR